MSENNAKYELPNGMIRLDDLRLLPCVLPYANPGYQRPTPGEVDALIKAVGWSQAEVAKIVGVSYNPEKGSTTVRKWRAPLHSTEYREIPYSAWRLLLIHAGIATK
jgi:hypothetical protein